MTTTAFAPAETATLSDVFSAYKISYLEVSDTPGEGTEVTAYSSDDSYIFLGMDADDDDCKGGYDWDLYTQLIFNLLYDKVGEYSCVEGTLRQRADGSFSFKGNVTTEVDV